MTKLVVYTNLYRSAKSIEMGSASHEHLVDPEHLESKASVYLKPISKVPTVSK
jgi:hypothetical protein